MCSSIRQEKKRSSFSMKVLAVSVFNCTQERCFRLLASYAVEKFNFFLRKSVREHMAFASRTVVARTEPVHFTQIENEYELINSIFRRFVLGKSHGCNNGKRRNSVQCLCPKIDRWSWCRCDYGQRVNSRCNRFKHFCFARKPFCRYPKLAAFQYVIKTVVRSVDFKPDNPLTFFTNPGNHPSRNQESNFNNAVRSNWGAIKKDQNLEPSWLAESLKQWQVFPFHPLTTVWSKSFVSARTPTHRR